MESGIRRGGETLLSANDTSIVSTITARYFSGIRRRLIPVFLGFLFLAVTCSEGGDSERK